MIQSPYRWKTSTKLKNNNPLKKKIDLIHSLCHNSCISYLFIYEGGNVKNDLKSHIFKWQFVARILHAHKSVSRLLNNNVDYVSIGFVGVFRLSLMVCVWCRSICGLAYLHSPSEYLSVVNAYSSNGGHLYT